MEDFRLEAACAAVRREAAEDWGALTEAINHEVRLRRAKYLGALADRLFRDECACLGLNADEAIKSPPLSTRQIGHVVISRATAISNSLGGPAIIQGGTLLEEGLMII
jgi:hypothetical protein